MALNVKLSIAGERRQQHEPRLLPRVALRRPRSPARLHGYHRTPITFRDGPTPETLTTEGERLLSAILRGWIGTVNGVAIFERARGGRRLTSGKITEPITTDEACPGAAIQVNINPITVPRDQRLRERLIARATVVRPDA